MGLFEEAEPKEYEIAGFHLRCEICKNTTFWHRHARLHTAVASFFDVEWLGRSADCMVCSRCGYIHWFLSQVLRETE